MKRVFVDTSAFFAHLVAEDRHHPQARALFEAAAREAWTLVTTNAVVSETYTLIRVRARNGRELAVAFLDDIRDGLCAVERVGPIDEARAMDLLRQYGDKSFSFCDALSFMAMERLGLTDAMAFDEDFRSYGKIVVLS